IDRLPFVWNPFRREDAADCQRFGRIEREVERTSIEHDSPLASFYASSLSGASWSKRQQSFPPISQQLLMADHPRRMRAAPGLALLGVDAAQPGPLAHGELGLADHPGEFLGRIPILDRLALDQGGQHLLDAGEPLVDRQSLRASRPDTHSTPPSSALAVAGCPHVARRRGQVRGDIARGGLLLRLRWGAGRKMAIRRPVMAVIVAMAAGTGR